MNAFTRFFEAVVGFIIRLVGILLMILLVGCVIYAIYYSITNISLIAFIFLLVLTGCVTSAICLLLGYLNYKISGERIHLHRFGARARWFFADNNGRLALCWITTFFCFLMLLNFPGEPILVQPTKEAYDKVVENKVAQKAWNAFWVGEYATGDQLKEDGNEKYKQLPSSLKNETKPEEDEKVETGRLNSWKWFSIFCWGLVISILYTPVAFSDEVHAWATQLLAQRKTRIHTRTGGTTSPVAGQTTQAGNNIFKVIAASLGAEAIIDYILKGIIHACKR